MEYKSVSTKMPREEVTLLKDYCKRKGTTPSSLIRKLILHEIEIPIPHSIAGMNSIKYDKEKDNFSWYVELDNKEKSEVISNISPEFLENLEQIISKSLDDRFTSLGKTINDSVPVPNGFFRRKND